MLTDRINQRPFELDVFAAIKTMYLIIKVSLLVNAPFRLIEVEAF